MIGSIPDCFARSDKLEGFINTMVTDHGFDRDYMNKTLDSIKTDYRVLKAIKRPSTAKPWHEFKEIFLSNNRTDKGVSFWKKNYYWLQQAKNKYGVPPEIVVSIIGVETIYGKRVGIFPVLDSLYTLGFKASRRNKFFRGELKHFFLMCRENNFDVADVKGSFAGAVGMPQFMPSSYRAYAVDFDKNGQIDLWNSLPDVIGSVANYLNVHGWERDKPIVFRSSFKRKEAFQLTKLGVKPHMKVSDLKKQGVYFTDHVKDSEEAAVLWLQGKKKREYWVSFKNFYAITRYNRSLNYAMVVHQLAQRIKHRYVN